MTPVPNLFQAPVNLRHPSCRSIHINRLHDILQLSLLRHDLVRAKRTWAILARCKEINWMSLWPTAVRLLGHESFDERDSSRKIEFLQELLVEFPAQREVLLKEIVLRQILSGNYREALGKLELYLPSFPYQDDPVLHTYAGLLCLYLSQSSEDGRSRETLLYSSRAYLKGALSVDPENAVASHFLQLVAKLTGDEHPDASESEEEDDMVAVKSPPRQRKKLRSTR